MRKTTRWIIFCDTVLTDPARASHAYPKAALRDQADQIPSSGHRPLRGPYFRAGRRASGRPTHSVRAARCSPLSPHQGCQGCQGTAKAGKKIKTDAEWQGGVWSGKGRARVGQGSSDLPSHLPCDRPGMRSGRPGDPKGLISDEPQHTSVCSHLWPANIHRTLSAIYRNTGRKGGGGEEAADE